MVDFVKILGIWGCTLGVGLLMDESTDFFFTFGGYLLNTFYILSCEGS